MKYLLAFSLLFAACSQTATLKGEIFMTDETGQSIKLGGKEVFIFKKETADSIENVFKAANKADFTTMTDSDGKFSIKLPHGWYVIAAKRGNKPTDECDQTLVHLNESEETVSLALTLCYNP